MNTDLIKRNPWIVAENFFRVTILASFTPSVKTYFTIPNLELDFLDRCNNALFNKDTPDIDQKVVNLVHLLSEHPELLPYFDMLPELKRCCMQLFEKYVVFLLSNTFYVGEMSISGDDIAGVFLQKRLTGIEQDDTVKELCGYTAEISVEEYLVLQQAKADFSVASLRSRMVVVCGPISLCNTACAEHVLLINKSNWTKCAWNTSGDIAAKTQVTISYCSGECKLDCEFRELHCPNPACDKMCCTGMNYTCMHICR